ncbi:MAG: glycine-rich protein [Crocinitomicaceae bacterium]
MKIVVKQLFFILSFLLLGVVSYTQEKVFTYTGDVQTYIVPPGVTEINVELRGAAGGYGMWEKAKYPDKYAPGKGGTITATYPVEPGEKIYVFVGGKGEDAKETYQGEGGYNGGGDGNNTGAYGPYCGGGGGGASDIRIGGTSLENRVLVAGGGGGAGSNYPAGGDHGGHGGGLEALDGQSEGKIAHSSCGGGATQTAGGKGGIWPNYLTAEEGKAGEGGNAPDSTSGGGGGGGWYGGGAGSWSGGGGGSNYADSKALEVKHQQGVNAENGRVIINPGCSDLLIATTTKGTLCEDEKTTLIVHGSSNVTWSDGVQDGVPFTPPAGINTYKVKREGKCPGEAEITIVVNQIKIIGSTLEETADHYGSIEIDVQGGTDPYTYTWTQDGKRVGTDRNLYDIKGGEYEVEVVDAIGCTDKKTFTVIQLKPVEEEAPGPKITADISEDQQFVTVGYPGPFEYKVEDMEGHTVITGHSVDTDKVDITRLKPGKYRVSLIYKQIKQYTTFVKR